MPYSRSSVVLALVGSIFLALTARGQEDPEKVFIGPNVNMVSGTEFPGGDPFLQRQNEVTGAVSSRNDLHLLAGANDYRAVDIPFEVSGPAGAESGGDSWLGVFTSTDGGSRWRSTLLPGYPQDLSCSPENTEERPALCGYQAGADAVVRAGTHGLFYYSGIVYDRGEGAPSAVFVSRFMDLNNDEGGDPIRHIDSVIVDSDEGLRFLDKPWIAVDVPRAGASSAMFQVPQGEGTVSQTVTCGRVYVAYAAITGSPSGGDLRSKILFRSSADCGETWSDAIELTDPDTLNQGASVAVSPTTGDVVVAWRQFSSVQSFLGEGLACAQPAGFWKTAEWPAATLTLGGVVYTKQQALNLLNGNPRGDATKILVHQLIPAKLNALAGTDDGLQNLIDLADEWLVANPIGSDPQGAPREEGLSIKNGLQTFNDGGDPALCGSTTPTTVLLDDAIVVAKSTDGGQMFSEPVVVSIATPFDQGSTEFSFRSTAYPSIAVDAAPSPRTYVVWSERDLPGSHSEVHESRIALSTSLDGSAWTEPVAVDVPDAPGHQIKPAILFTGGKLVLAYYDFRQDVSNIFEQFVADWPLADRLRHTVDVRVAIADPGESPEFTNYSVLDPATEPRKPSQQASRYPFVIVGNTETDAETIQLQYMTPNVPLFAGGTRPFIGDFIDVLGQFFVREPEPDGTWRFATEPGDAGVYHAVWADNRDVVPPEDGDWTSYVPPLLEDQTGPRPSVFDPAFTVPDCNAVALGAERTGMRNQNIYTAVMTRGLLVAAPGNTKLLGELVQATFVVFVQNVTDQDRRFRLTAVQPEDGDASFDQLMLLTEIDVTVPAYSSASRTVYLRSPDPTATALVLVTEIDFGGNPILGGLTGSVRLNPDPTSPAPNLSTGEIHTPAILNPAIFNPAILNPAIFNPAILNPAILNPAIFNPAIFNPAILNPAIFNPAIFNPAILNPAIFNPAIFNPAIFNPAILNPAILNPAILNPAILNPAILNPAIFNPAILNPAILNPAILNTALDETSQAADYTFAVRNDGTTTTAYDLNFNVGEQPEGLIYQLVVFRLNVTPVADGCNLVEEAQQELLVNLLDPEVHALRLLDPAAADPSTATFSIEPGGVVFVTLRVLPDVEASVPGNPATDFNRDNVSVAVVSQALDTADLVFGDTQPSFDVIVAPSTPVESLSFVMQPTTATGGHAIPTVEVEARDNNGMLLPGVILEMTIGTAACGSAALAGGVVAVTDAAGVASFSTMSIDRGGYGYELRATAIGFPAVSTLSTPFDVEGFCETGSLATARGQNSATLLPTGKVLFVGGAIAIGEVTASAELFDPVGNGGTGSFSSTGGMNTARGLPAATLLPNGKVLIAGGGPGTGGTISSAELFDPAGDGGVGSFTPTEDMALARGPTATLLPNGKVLIVGGTLVSASAELFDPAGNAGLGDFSLTGSMSTPRSQHTAVLLPDGKVLVSGGVGVGGVLAGGLASAELYDPATGTFSLTGSMSTGRYSSAATLLPDGKVLVSGGHNGSDYTASADLYDPTTGTFSPTGSLGTARAVHASTLLPNGKVLISGGIHSGGFLASAELYDPTTGTFSPTGSMIDGRRSAEATLLPNGRVLIGGGVGNNPPSFTLSGAELFYPIDPPFTVAGFESTGSMGTARHAHTATLLPDGRILVAGGITAGGARVASAELYNSASGSFVPTGSMGTPRSHHTASLLPNGEVLIAGGITNGVFGSPSLNTAETYDPVSGSFSPTGVMSVERGSGHTATLLPKAKVLIVGGSGGLGSVTSAELYDPATRTFSPTGGMVQPRLMHTATLLPNGKVLIAGGASGLGTTSAELYDPDTGTFTSTGSMGTRREQHVATLLSNGKVLVIGGSYLDFDTGNGVTLASAEVYDPALDTFSPVGDMNSPRRLHTATALANGKVLISGGNTSGPLVPISELYDPATATFSLTGSLIRPRSLHTATMLPNGKVLFAGGGSGTITPASAELYRPGH